MPSNKKEIFAEKVRNLVDVEVVLDVPIYTPYAHSSVETLEQYKKEATSWIQEINELLNEHKSFRGVSASIKETKEDQCSVCDRTWETYIDEDLNQVECCAHCGVPIKLKDK